MSRTWPGRQESCGRHLFLTDILHPLHLPVNARVQNMFSRDVKRLSFRCQSLKFSRPNVKLSFSALLKGKMFSINKKRRNYQLSMRNQVKELAQDCFSEVQAAGLKCRSQVTGHRSGHRLDHRSHTRTIGHRTKLFVIDILLYKNKTSKGTSIIFFLFWTLPNPTHEKIYSCWSRKEDFRYSVTKVGNEIIKVRKITWFVRKNESQNEGLLR